MAQDELGSDFVKLGEKNYLKWESKMRIKLAKFELLKYIDKSMNAKKRDEKNKMTEAECIKSQKAAAFMLEGMEDTLQIDYLDEKNAAAMWDAMESRFASSKGDAQQRLHREYNDLRFSSVATFIAEFKHMVYSLRVCKVQMLEVLMVGDFLRKLPKQFDALVHAIKTKEELSLEYCYTRVQDAYDLDPAQYSNIKSFYVAGQARGEARKETRACFRCGVVGHLIKDCKAKEKSKERKVENTQDSSWWFIDSCASSHMTPNLSSFASYTTLDGGVTVANGETLPICGIGSVAVTCDVGGHCSSLILLDCLHVKGLKESLISVSKLDVDGVRIAFGNQQCTLTSNGLVIGKGVVDSGVYRLHPSHKAYIVKLDVNIAHRRFGHTPSNTLVKSGIQLTGVEEFCDVCAIGKSHRQSFGRHSRECDKTNVHDVVVADVAGPFNVPTFDGFAYFLTFVDALSGFVVGYLMKQKSEVVQRFKEYEALSANRHKRTILTFRTDNGSEFVNKEMAEYLVERGITHQKSNVYTPQQNGIAERMNRTVLNKVRCLLLDAECGLEMWGEAFLTAIQLINRTRNSFSTTTPYESEFQRKPCNKLIRRFGCTAFCHIPEEKRSSKLTGRAEKMMLVGYSGSRKGWRLYCREKNHIVESGDVQFNETENYWMEVEDRQLAVDDDVVMTSASNLGDHDFVPDNEIVDEDRFEVVDERNDDDGNEDDRIEPNDENGAVNVPNGEVVDELRRSTRLIRRPPVSHTARLVSEISVPKSYKEMMESPDVAEWKCAMDAEMKGLRDNGTWDFVKIGEDMKPIGCKWVFTVKTNADGSIERLKARLVVMGNMQREGHEYKETFAPVIHFNSLRTIAAVSVEQDLILDQSDVTRAFLQGDIDERIYMRQPRGYHNGEADEVCLLKRSLYGLKQAPRQWNKKLNEKLLDAGFHRSRVDPCVYMLKESGVIHILGVYVDDIIQASSSQKSIDRINSLLATSFPIVHIGKPSKILGVEIHQDLSAGTITFGLETFTKTAINEFLDDNLKQISTPEKLKSKKDREIEVMESKEVIDPERYRRAVGSLLYVSSRTRPDIASAVRVASQDINTPTRVSWDNVTRIFQYLKGTSTYNLTYRKGGGCKVKAWSDADYANCPVTRRSVSGVVVKVGKNTVLWKSKKQETTTLSTTESEYMAVVEAAKEVLWLRQLLEELGFRQEEATTILDDNIGCIQLGTTAITLPRSKHIDVRHHFVREKVERGELELKFTKSVMNVADLMTKAIPTQLLESHVATLGLSCKRR